MFGGGMGRTQEVRFTAQERKFKATHPRRLLAEPTRDPDGMRFSLGATAARAAHTTLKGVESIAGGPSRRTYAARQSETAKWKPGLRPVGAPKPKQDKAQGLRSIPIPKPAEVVAPERVHWPEKWNTRTTAVSEFAGGGLGAKIRVKDERGQPRCERQADEQDVSRIFGRKRRIDPTETGRLRNGVGVSRPGDKRYSHPDYAPGFFKGGGVYPGANWGHHTTQFAAAAKKTQQAEAAAASGRMTYEQRRRYEIIRKEIEEVRALNPETHDGETWESRTGKFTVAPPQQQTEPAGDEEEEG